MLLVLGRVTLLTLCPAGHFLEGEPGTRAGVWSLEQPRCVAPLPNASFLFPHSLSTPDRLKGKDAKPCGLDILVTFVDVIKCLFWQQWNVPEPGMKPGPLSS